MKLIYVGEGIDKATLEDAKLCTSCSNERFFSGMISEDLIPSHRCPFQVDIRDNSEFKCNCCSECTHQCSMDI